MSSLAALIRDLEAQRDSIDSALRNLKGLTGAVGPRGGRRGGARNMSEEGRQRIADAQRKRWAKIKAAQRKRAA